MIYLLSSLTGFILTALATAYGVKHLFKKGTALYFQLMVCAVACYCLEELFAVINVICAGPAEPITVGLLGILGANCFMMSANFGQLDGLVDGGEAQNKKARTIALFTAVFFAVCLFSFLLIYGRENRAYAIIYIVLSMPAVFSSYFNLKHLLLPLDDLGLLKATRLCNISVLAFYAVSLVYLVGFIFDLEIVLAIGEVALTLPLLMLTFAAKKGADLWKI